MFKYICLIALLSFASAAPVDDLTMLLTDPEVKAPHVEIIDSGLQQAPDGSYSFHYRGEDGSFREETAVVINPGTEDSYLQISGSYSFFDANGKEVVVTYKADDHGFVPEGTNISHQISMAAKHNSQLPPYQEKQKHPKTLAAAPIWMQME